MGLWPTYSQLVIFTLGCLGQSTSGKYQQPGDRYTSTSIHSVNITTQPRLPSSPRVSHPTTSGHISSPKINGALVRVHTKSSTPEAAVYKLNATESVISDGTSNEPLAKSPLSSTSVRTTPPDTKKQNSSSSPSHKLTGNTTFKGKSVPPGMNSNASYSGTSKVFGTSVKPSTRENNVTTSPSPSTTGTSSNHSTGAISLEYGGVCNLTPGDLGTDAKSCTCRDQRSKWFHEYATKTVTTTTCLHWSLAWDTTPGPLNCFRTTDTQLAKPYSQPTSCCDRCRVGVATVRLMYWPPSRTGEASSANGPASGIVSGIVSDGYRFVSPSAYLELNSVYASTSCVDEGLWGWGNLGTKGYEQVIRGYKPEQLSSARCLVNDPVDGENLAQCFYEGGCFSGTDTGWEAINFEELANPPPDSVIYSRKRKCFSSEALLHFQTKDAIQMFKRPRISLPDDVRSIDPLWKNWANGRCVGHNFGADDPPLTLSSASALSPSSHMIDFPHVIELSTKPFVSGPTPTEASPGQMVEHTLPSSTQHAGSGDETKQGADTQSTGGVHGRPVSGKPGKQSTGVKPGSNDAGDSWKFRGFQHYPLFKHAGNRLVPDEPADRKPANHKPIESKPVDDEPANDKPADGKPASPKSANDSPSDHRIKDAIRPSRKSKETFDSYHEDSGDETFPKSLAKPGVNTSPSEKTSNPKSHQYYEEPQKDSQSLSPPFTLSAEDQNGAYSDYGAKAPPVSDGTIEKLPNGDIVIPKVNTMRSPGGRQSRQVTKPGIEPGTEPRTESVTKPVTKPVEQPSLPAITIAPGAQSIVRGHPVSNAAGGVVIDGNTFSYSEFQPVIQGGDLTSPEHQIVQVTGSALKLGQHTLLPGSGTTIVSGHEVVYHGLGDLKIDGHPFSLSSLSPTQRFALAGITGPVSRDPAAPNDVILFNSVHIRPGASAVKVGDHKYSLDSDATHLVQDGVRTFDLPPLSDAFVMEAAESTPAQLYNGKSSTTDRFSRDLKGTGIATSHGVSNSTIAMTSATHDTVSLETTAISDAHDPVVESGGLAVYQTLMEVRRFAFFFLVITSYILL